MNTIFKKFKTSLIFLLAFLYTGTALSVEFVSYYHNDALGSPIATTDETGNKHWEEVYEPYGERYLKEPQSGDNRVFYVGKLHDDELGLSYMNARYYDPLVGRFMGVDPVGFVEGNSHSFNRYTYANNNPYKFVDPDGNYAEAPFEAASIAYGLKSFYDNVTSGNHEAARVDLGGLATDVGLLFIPGVPGVAGLGIKATREAAELAAKGSLWTSTKGKSAVENAFSHYKKHKSEFPEFLNAKQYVEGAKKFLNSPPPGTLRKTRSNGDTLFYNPRSNIFGVKDANGLPRTMFRPKDGIEYWNKQ